MSDMRAKATVVKHNATRQFRHNDDNSPNPFQPEGGFVFAYDILIIDKFLAELLKKVDELESKLDYPHEEIREMQTKLDAVRPYIAHHRTCPMYRMKQGSDLCNCGLAALQGEDNG